MSYAVLHIDKAPVSGGLAVHIDRRQGNGQAYVPNNADAARLCDNFHVFADMEGKTLCVANERETTLQERIDKRVEEGHTCGRKVRVDAVKSLNLVLSGSNEGFAKMSPQQVQNWAMRAYEWVATNFGGMENVVGFAVHLDERTPHVHATVVPINGNRLQAQHFIGSPAKLARLQTSFANHMKEFGFERGQHYTHRQETPRHSSTAEFYQAYQELTPEELQHIEELLQPERERLIRELVEKKLAEKQKPNMEPRFHPERKHQRQDRLHRPRQTR